MPPAGGIGYGHRPHDYALLRSAFNLRCPSLPLHLKPEALELERTADSTRDIPQ